MDTTRTEAQGPFVLTLALNLTDTASSGFAFDQAARVAARIPRSHMHIVYVLDADATPELTRQAAGLLGIYATEKYTAIGGSGQMFGVHVRRGDAAREVAQFASEVSSDLIVVGSHKTPHLKAIFMGSTAERVMAAAACPVLVACPRPKPVASHVIVIEAACPDCVARRTATAGREWWCERHSERHLLGRRHVYSYQSELPFGAPDMSVNPASPID